MRGALSAEDAGAQSARTGDGRSVETRREHPRALLGVLLPDKTDFSPEALASDKDHYI